jgi:hypothetical protein
MISTSFNLSHLADDTRVLTLPANRVDIELGGDVWLCITKVGEGFA